MRTTALRPAELIHPLDDVFGRQPLELVPVTGNLASQCRGIAIDRPGQLSLRLTPLVQCGFDVLSLGARPGTLTPKGNPEVVAAALGSVSPFLGEHRRTNDFGLLHVSPASAGRLSVSVTIGR
jgi:hypothetical protein